MRRREEELTRNQGRYLEGVEDEVPAVRYDFLD